jgi:hypothetical protein
LSEILHELAKFLAPLVKAEIGSSAVWVSQKESPLGRNRHCAAVKRRIAEGSGGATKLGNRCLLTAEALKEEMEAHHKLVARPPVKVAVPDEKLPPIIQRVNARIARGG